MLARRHGERAGPATAELTPGAIERLMSYPWPGNLRQLDNVIRRAYTMALAERDGPPVGLTVDEYHLSRALAYEQVNPERSLVETLHAAATAFVREAERRAAARTPLELELADAFQGLVLLAATEKLDSRDEAFRLFGREAQVRSRNHHKILRRESERVEALCRALGSDAGLPLARLREGSVQDG
jgi:transcriptional regulator with GAF, ATPase, and Fis domain